MEEPGFQDSEWRTLHLPHDWSVEGNFSETNPWR
jgi:beta-galactosidase